LAGSWARQKFINQNEAKVTRTNLFRNLCVIFSSLLSFSLFHRPVFTAYSHSSDQRVKFVLISFVIHDSTDFPLASYNTEANMILQKLISTHLHRMEFVLILNHYLD